MPGLCQAPSPVMNDFSCPACVRLNYCSCQPECQANVWLMSGWFPVVYNYFLIGSYARLITAHFLLCQVLVRLFTALSSWALVRLMLGLCLVQMSGCIRALEWPDISP